MAADLFRPTYSRDAHVGAIVGVAVVWASVLAHVFGVIAVVVIGPLLSSWFGPGLRVTPLAVEKSPPVEMAVIEMPPKLEPEPEPLETPQVAGGKTEAAAGSIKRVKAKSKSAKRRAIAKQLAMNSGILGILSSSSGSTEMASLFGSADFSSGLAEGALGGLIGNEVGESHGFGGLGIAGTGRGGGGTGEGTIGLGSYGTIGRGAGTGGTGSGYGSGGGRLSSRSASTVRLGRVVARGMDAAVARRVARRGLSRVRRCEPAGTDISGQLKLRLDIDDAGRVSAVSLVRPVADAIDGCVQRAVKRMRFPRPAGASASVTLAYAF